MSGKAEQKSFSIPDETRTFDYGALDLLRIGGGEIGLLTLQPGWRWSECIKPVAGTDSCQARHVGTVVSGRIHVKHDDGTEAEMGPGDAYVIEPGHDAWIVGNEPLVGFEFESTTASSYAKPS